MAHQNVSQKNLLLNINLEVQKAFKTDEDLKDEWKRNANKYQVKISYFTKSYVTDYYMGSGLVNKKGQPKKPDKKGVLKSMVLNDVRGMDFEDFCFEFGYNTDSMSAFKIYEACQRETRALYNMFDKEEIDMLRELLEDY